MKVIRSAHHPHAQMMKTWSRQIVWTLKLQWNRGYMFAHEQMITSFFTSLMVVKETPCTGPAAASVESRITVDLLLLRLRITLIAQTQCSHTRYLYCYLYIVYPALFLLAKSCETNKYIIAPYKLFPFAFVSGFR
jgi:hypothetical protein